MHKVKIESEGYIIIDPEINEFFKLQSKAFGDPLSITTENTIKAKLLLKRVEARF